MHSKQAVEHLAWLDAVPSLYLNLLATVLIGVGFYLIYRHWQNNSLSKVNLWLGWFVILFAVPVVIVADDVEFGLVNFSVLIAVLAWCVALLNINALSLRVMPQKEKPVRSSSKKISISLHALAIILIWPLISLLVTLAIGSLLPIALSAQLVIEALLFPIIWGLLAIWLCYSSNYRQMLLVTLIVTLVSIGILFGYFYGK